VLGPDEIRAAVTLPAAVEAVEAASVRLARGHVDQPAPLGLDLPGGEVHVKCARLGPGHPVVVKVATGFAGNASRGLPTGDGLMVVLDPDSGQVTAVLLDRGWLTDVRTAAATAVAVRHLRPGGPRRLALLGTGVQAGLTLRVLDAVGLLPAEVSVWGRTPGRARDLVERPDLARPGLTWTADARDAVRGADVVVTTTPSRTPVLSGGWLEDDALVVAVGADSPGKRECDAAVLRRAGTLVVDDPGQALAVGELQHATTADLQPHPPWLLGDLLLDPGAVPVTGIRLCDLTGLGAHDAAVAGVALREAR
jgi:ornithine cyclodeaminase